MNFLEALKTGKKIRRPRHKENHGDMFFDMEKFQAQCFREDYLAEDWEVEGTMEAEKDPHKLAMQGLASACEPEKLKESFEFKAKDKVKCAFFGDEALELKDSLNHNHPLVIYRGNDFYLFTKNGMFDLTHTHPILTLVERPEPRIEELWVNILHYKEGQIYSYGFNSYEEAKLQAGVIGAYKKEIAVKFVRSKEQ